jgi:hypothetical protein
MILSGTSTALTWHGQVVTYVRTGGASAQTPLLCAGP